MAFNTRLFLVVTSGFLTETSSLPLSNTVTDEVLSGQWWLKGCEMIPGFIQVTGFSHGLLFPVMPHPVFLGTKFSSQADCLMRKGNQSPSITKNQLSCFHSHLMSSHRWSPKKVNLIQAIPQRNTENLGINQTSSTVRDTEILFPKDSFWYNNFEEP